MAISIATASRSRRVLLYGLVAAGLSLFLIASWRARMPLSIRGSDQLVYLSLSHSLENGSYRDTFLVGAPPHLQYPPGYPLWLIPIRHLTAESLDGIKLINLFLAAGGLLLLYGAARRLLTPGLAVALVFLLATTPVLLEWSSSMMSESLFLILSTGSLVAAFTADRRGGSAVPATVAGWLAFLTRTPGIALIAALGLWLWHRRRPSELWVYAIGSAIVLGGWFGYSLLTPESSFGRSYESDLLVIGSHPERGALGSLLVRWPGTAISYATGMLPSSLSLPTLPGTMVDNLFWLVLTIGLLGVGAVWLWRRWRLVAWYLVFYTVMLVVWPWPYERLLVPILPLVLLTMLGAADALTSKSPSGVRRLLLGALVGLIGIGTVKGTLARDQQRRHCDRSDPLHSPGCYQPEILSLIAGMEYIGARGGPEDVVLTSEPATVYYLTGRRTISSKEIAKLPEGGAAGWLREFDVRFVLLSSVRPADRGSVGQALRASCGELHLAARFEPHTLVLVPVPPGAGGTEACGPLAQFLEDMRAYGDRDP